MYSIGVVDSEIIIRNSSLGYKIYDVSPQSKNRLQREQFIIDLVYRIKKSIWRLLCD